MLHEEFRPKTWDQVVGQPKALKIIDSLRNRKGLAGNAYWLAGESGIGKTTIANLIANEVSEYHSQIDLDATGLSAAEVSKIERDLRCFGMGQKTGRAVTINEAHGLRRDTIRQLLVTLERIPKHVVWIFTTTKQGEAKLFDDCDDTSPLLSRCIKVPLTNQGLSGPFAERVMDIAVATGLDGARIRKDFETLAKKHRNNMRAMLSDIESGCFL